MILIWEAYIIKLIIDAFEQNHIIAKSCIMENHFHKFVSYNLVSLCSCGCAPRARPWLWLSHASKHLRMSFFNECIPKTTTPIKPTRSLRFPISSFPFVLSLSSFLYISTLTQQVKVHQLCPLDERTLFTNERDMLTRKRTQNQPANYIQVYISDISIYYISNLSIVHMFILVIE